MKSRRVSGISTTAKSRTSRVRTKNLSFTPSRRIRLLLAPPVRNGSSRLFSFVLGSPTSVRGAERKAAAELPHSKSLSCFRAERKVSVFSLSVRLDLFYFSFYYYSEEDGLKPVPTAWWPCR